MKIAVIGMGYVGLSNAILLAQKHCVKVVDINEEKVNMLNNRISPIVEAEIESYLKNQYLNISATKDLADAVRDAEYVFVATPTDFKTDVNYFDTSSVDAVLRDVTKINPQAVVVIKSTVPIGYTAHKRMDGYCNVIFVPEFLRESLALHDNLYPSRIVIGEKSKRAEALGELLANCALKKDVRIFYTNSTEAESIKLFSNTYLAARVAFFNELDSFALVNGLNSRDIIEGVTADPRIGKYYCNPSFGYGGYCLPKDTKQLLSNFVDVPESLIGSIVEANRIRKDLIAQQILKLKPNMVGVFRLVMKTGSDNFRSSAIQGVMRRLSEKGVNLILYEPLCKQEKFYNAVVVKNLDDFKRMSDIILTNRWCDDLLDVKDRIFTRDLFHDN